MPMSTGDGTVPSHGRLTEFVREVMAASPEGWSGRRVIGSWARKHRNPRATFNEREWGPLQAGQRVGWNTILIFHDWLREVRGIDLPLGQIAEPMPAPER